MPNLMPISRPTDKPLLAKLKHLVELDQFYETEPNNPQHFKARAEIFQSFGLHSIAKYENRLRAEKEHLSDIEFYNQHYDDRVNETDFAQIYQAENSTLYYETLILLVKFDQYFLSAINPKRIIERAGSLGLLGLTNLAIRDYDFVLNHISTDSEYYAVTCLSKAYKLNLKGNYEEGLKLYEMRWLTNDEPFKEKIQFPCPRWKGEKFDYSQGKLLIYREQGIGDSLQFIRYAILLKQRGVDILVWNNNVIDDFLRFNLARYGIPCAEPDQTAQLAYEIPLMSLPYLFETRVDNIPLTDKYLVASPEYIQKWQAKLTLNKNRLNVGFVFRSRESKLRNIDLSFFKTLFQFDAQFHCLQKEINAEELAILTQYNNISLYHTEIHSFLDTSAIVEQLDLIITIDTAVAHLSAAMGKPTWILLNHIPDFRWLLNREESIWYNSVRLFRQDLDYDWARVIERVSLALAQYKITKDELEK